ncbi:lectin [Stenotrophomonas sp. JC08]|uniref:lectin n=1 Tax=Stenotrophomonas sp. JC08 TaxID=3445779 RepID=UPI003FA1AECE
MNHIALLLLILAGLLGGCERPPAPDTPPRAAEPTPSSAATPAKVASGDASLKGYGPLQLGIGAEQLRTLWPGELQGDVVADGGCYYLSPAGEGDARPFFMIEGNRFVRYDLRSSAAPAPGGGTVGMELAQLQALYPHADAPQPHKYVAGGKVLRVPAAEGGAGVLVIELDADGKASAWRVGLPPQVDYVEGCG